jgi:hypothetical protein
VTGLGDEVWVETTHQDMEMRLRKLWLASPNVRHVPARLVVHLFLGGSTADSKGINKFNKPVFPIE